jgi:hypothetical protein
MTINDMALIAPRIQAVMERACQAPSDLAVILGVDPDDAQGLLDGHRGLASGELAAICESYSVSTDEILFGRDSVVLMRADDDADVRPVVAQVEAVFDDYLYLQALVGA